MYDDHESTAWLGIDEGGGIAQLDFELLTPATIIQVTERDLGHEFGPGPSGAHVACIALRRWQARAKDDITLIERLADADFAIAHHADADTTTNHPDGSVSVSASMWFPGIDEADATLRNLGANSRWATFTPVDRDECSRFIVGLGSTSTATDA